MKAKVALAGLIGLSLIFLMGCDGEEKDSIFFGIRVFSSAKADKALYNVRFDENGTIKYTWDPNLADESISCKAATGISAIKFRIYNESKQPIRMNYFADSYKLVTEDGRVFLLEIMNPATGDFGYPNLINPGQMAKVNTRYPPGLEIAEVETALIETDYNEIIIVLKRIK